MRDCIMQLKQFLFFIVDACPPSVSTFLTEGLLFGIHRMHGTLSAIWIEVDCSIMRFDIILIDRSAALSRKFDFKWLGFRFHHFRSHHPVNEENVMGEQHWQLPAVGTDADYYLLLLYSHKGKTSIHIIDPILCIVCIFLLLFFIH